MTVGSETLATSQGLLVIPTAEEQCGYLLDCVGPQYLVKSGDACRTTAHNDAHRAWGVAEYPLVGCSDPVLAILQLAIDPLVLVERH